MRTAIPVMALAFGLFLFSPVVAQPPLGGKPPTPAELFRTARELIQEGRFDVAADTLKNFLEAAQEDQDYLALMEREPTVFQRLRGVPIWSEDPKVQAEALKTVDNIVKRADQANRKIFRDPARVSKFVNNLGATLEERLYAEDQLIKAGDSVVPVMVESLRVSSSVEVRTGIFGAITKLGSETIPGFLAALDGLSDDNRLGILRGLTSRTDVLSLLSTAETDFSPQLWYYASKPASEAGQLRTFAVQILESLGATPARRVAETELVRLAEPFTNKTARYRFPNRIKLWTWDEANAKLLAWDASREQADDFYAIRNLKWANERNPNYPPAQDLFLSFALQRAVEKAKFGDLALTNTTLFQVAASAGSPMLIRLLDQALTSQKTALVLGLCQLLGSRADRAAVLGTSPSSPGVLIRALDFPDPRVQLAAALAVLRSQVITHGKSARIVDILQKAVAADTGDGVTPEMGRALIVDPLGTRASRVSGYLQQLGYATEYFPKGQDFLRRAARNNDFDLVILDRHTADPRIEDVLAQLQPNQSSSRTPILVIASPTNPKPLPLESLMLRLAKYIAVTETAGIEIPTPFAFNPGKAFADVEAARIQANRVRDFQLLELHKVRVERMTRIMLSVGLPTSAELLDRLTIRTSQLTYAVLSAEYGLSATSAPDTFKRYALLNEQIAQKTDLHTAIENLPLEQLGKILEQLDSALDEARQQKFELLTSRVMTDLLNLPADVSRDLELEEELSRQLRRFPSVTVIPEPYSLVGFTDEVRNSAADPAQLPRDLSEKQQSALTAVMWLRKLALGEVPGYDIRPAESALLKAMRNDSLAEPAIDAVAKISTAPCQQDLVSVAITATRPLPLRLQAAERAIQHIQTFGKLIPENQRTALLQAAGEEAKPELRAKLLVLSNLVNARNTDLGQLINSYPVPLPKPPAAPMPPKAEEANKDE